MRGGCAPSWSQPEVRPEVQTEVQKRTLSGVIFLVMLACSALVTEQFLTLDVSARTDAMGTPRNTLLFTRAPSYSAQAWIRGEERFPQGGSIVVGTGIGIGIGKEAHALVSDFAATVDPSLNPEATTVLFAGKKKLGDPWQVYEVAMSDGTARRVTSGEEDCVRPMYLPDGRIVYARKTGGRFVLEAASLDGSGKPLRLTYAPGNFLPTAVLHDGRVLFESSFPIGSAGQPEIYTVYPDGSGVEAYRCDHGHARSNGTQVATGDIVFASERGLGRFTSALAHEISVNIAKGSVPEGDYSGGIAETETGALILSFRPAQSAKKACTKTTAAEASYALKRWTPGARTLTPLAAEPGQSLVEPVVVAPRPVGNRFPSALHDWKTTNLLALNSYISREGEIAAGTLAAVRVLTADASGRVKVLGTAPVEKDGSFFVQAPGDSPLKFELVDAQGNIVRKESGWIWARGGEQRICVGCHAGPERAPDNAVPAVLLRTTTPSDMTGTAAEAAKGVN